MENNGRNIIRVQNLRKNFKVGEHVVTVLSNINLTVNRGQIISIIGPSGCGKTTLLNLIGGLDKPSKGKILLDGIDINLIKEEELSRIRTHEIGLVFQNFNLLPEITVLENIKFPMLIAGVHPDKQRIRALELIEKMGLNSKENHMPHELSGGERQRVAIARALSNRPSILLLDEPTGDLDSETGNKIIRLIKNISESEGQTVLIVTHDESITKVSKKSYLLENGIIQDVTTRNEN